ncbi:hypothetical protein RB614_13350 [Phytohabitans sp. ZYX-F-186]|uniref:REase associating with pPIWI RE domain-containing protein n=1 Tax=Phytohabitans maris TaxID=3071409 RepID=A0ABU0ZGV5_9ACTN|nr:hypothetical protein [Phytohabitans sp. ZYX-F-186]MDQ7905510.1 hypothetical protein [Phytohabitans sp. ZYX-F-186]
MSTSDDWYRRYEANQKVPSLPVDDYGFDQALSELRAAVGEIAPDAVAAIPAVLRILRHRRSMAAQVLDKREPTCLGCGADRKCVGCDDIRPTAEKLYAGWRFVSPLDRWETVERVEQANEYAPVRVWTDKTGPAYSWLIPRWQKVDAVAPPPRTLHGTPEIRVFEHGYARDAPMYAIPTLDTVYRPDTSDHLVEARYSRERGWAVTHRPNGGDSVTVWCESKAKARTALRSAAREHAKALGVKVVVQPTSAVTS